MKDKKAEYQTTPEKIKEIEEINPDHRIKKVDGKENTYILRGVSKLQINIQEDDLDEIYDSEYTILNTNKQLLEDKEIDMTELSLDKIVNDRVDAGVKKAEDKFNQKMAEAYAELEKLKKDDRIGILRGELEKKNKEMNTRLGSVENMGEITVIVNKEQKKKKPVIVSRVEKLEAKFNGMLAALKV